MAKIINDPVYGFVKVPSGLPFDIIQHHYFQRLRRIKQLGIADLVYPGAIHTRFQHALGSMYLMSQALDQFQSKGVLIMDVEREAALVAILLHDIGHGPFSHVLEYSILQNVHHEQITAHAMKMLNEQFQGKLTLAIEMFEGRYERKFFHQLISSQLDMDRLDYISRDSFFTGVVEGSIGVQRLIKMLNVVDDSLVVEEKGVLSVENFLHARRLMYWQVYLHKTSICAEALLKSIFQRVRDLLVEGAEVQFSSRLSLFFKNDIDFNGLSSSNSNYFETFMLLDDYDVIGAIKNWCEASDPILSRLAQAFLNRNLFKYHSFESDEEKGVLLTELIEKYKMLGFDKKHFKYFYHEGEVSNAAYLPENQKINVLLKKGNVVDITEASDLPTIEALGRIVKKSYLCYLNPVYL